MRYLVILIVAALLCSAAPAVQAQKEQKDVARKPEPASVTVTGCLARGTEGGALLLTHALRTDAPAKPKAEATKAGKGANATPNTYALVGGTALDAHLGHKVEIAGTLAKPAPPVDPKPGMLRKTYDTLTVKTVKMVSASCP
jgi:hypothetical protein